MKLAIPRELRSAIFDSIAIQMLIGFLAGITLDGGFCFQIWVFAMAAYWGGCSLVLIRRWKMLTKTDLGVIRWGFLILAIIVTPLLSVWIWKLRGLIL